MGKLIVGLMRFLPLCAVVLMLSAMMLPDTAFAQAPPRITLIPNQTSFESGDTHILTAIVTPGGSVSLVDVYVAIQLPDQTLFFYQSNGSFTTEMEPLVRSWTVSPFSGEIFRYTFNGAEPAGTYTWYAAFTNPGTLNFIGDIAQAPFTFNSFQPYESGCADAYFIGVHGFGEGPDLNGVGSSDVLIETWTTFKNFAYAAGKINVKRHYLRYPTPEWQGLDPFGIGDAAYLLGVKERGVLELDSFVWQTVLKECPLDKNPKIVLVGYSFGAWVINEWLHGASPIWEYIRAVELYGDPMWYRFGPAFLADPPKTYKGLVRHAHDKYFLPIPPSYDNDPQGPGERLGKNLSERWQSRCLVGDPICGEGYSGSGALEDQIRDAKLCEDDKSCIHRQYHVGRDDEWTGFQFRPATKLTTNGAHFLALKTFPEIFTGQHPRNAHVETFVEGVHVYFRLYYTDPHNEVNGFGFVGVNGSGWGEETHSFSNLPYWARYRPGFNRVDYPFNHLCGTPSAYESDVEAWVVVRNPDGSVRDGSPGVPIHMTCNAPKEVITPFFDH